MEFQKLLKELKNITPDPAYRARSRSVLLATLDAQPRQPLEKQGFFAVFWDILSTKPAMAAETIAFIALVTLGGLYLHRQSTDKLVVQANDVNSSIQVKLDEIKYLLNKNQPLFSPQKTKELNILLNDAKNFLKEAEGDLNTANLEDSLRKLKIAEETFAQFESTAAKAK